MRQSGLYTHLHGCDLQGFTAIGHNGWAVCCEVFDEH